MLEPAWLGDCSQVTSSNLLELEQRENGWRSNGNRG
jgi:hypothetical protein